MWACSVFLKIGHDEDDKMLTLEVSSTQVDNGHEYLDNTCQGDCT